MESSSSTKSRTEALATAELYRNLRDVVVSETRSRPPPPAASSAFSVCYVIVSTSSATWTVTTLIASALVGVSMLTPYWLVAPPVVPRRRGHLPPANRTDHAGVVSMGVFSECSGHRGPQLADVLDALTGSTTAAQCATFVDGSDQILFYFFF